MAGRAVACFFGVVPTQKSCENEVKSNFVGQAFQPVQSRLESLLHQAIYKGERATQNELPFISISAKLSNPTGEEGLISHA